MLTIMEKEILNLFRLQLIYPLGLNGITGHQIHQKENLTVTIIILNFKEQ